MIVNRKMAEDAYELLSGHQDGPDTGQLVDATEAGVNALYRHAATKTHPDVEGGSIEQFAAVDRAKHVLLEWLKREEVKTPIQQKEDCQRCEGKGFIDIQRGFRSMRVACPRCRGSGDADYDHDKNDHFQGR